MLGLAMLMLTAITGAVVNTAAIQERYVSMKMPGEDGMDNVLCLTYSGVMILPATAQPAHTPFKGGSSPAGRVGLAPITLAWALQNAENAEKAPTTRAWAQQNARSAARARTPPGRG